MSWRKPDAGSEPKWCFRIRVLTDNPGSIFASRVLPGGKEMSWERELAYKVVKKVKANESEDQSHACQEYTSITMFES
jgi:hypothetical protein